MNPDNSEGQTPLDEEEKAGLLISTVTTRGELDEFEQLNIERAVQWSLQRSFKPEVVFTAEFIRQLHKRMFSDVWQWAGNFRKSNKNIGSDHWKISTELKHLLDDARFWHENNTFRPDEIAVRLKHRLVSIHCFPNGNGRHSRLLADILIGRIYKQPVFTWGAGLPEHRDVRGLYLQAVRAADRGDYGLLMEFVRL